MNAAIPCIHSCVLGALLAIAPAYGEITSRRLLAAILLNTPEPEIVAAGMSLKTAEQVARQRGEPGALWGTGESMQPLYAPGTALVIGRHDFEKLKAGMTVVYLNAHGRRVAHCIVGETRGGYLLQGVNNGEEDAELLTEDNFIGVVVAAYASSGTGFREATLAKLSTRLRKLVAPTQPPRRNDLVAGAATGRPISGLLAKRD
jgi:hypothetical protein